MIEANTGDPLHEYDSAFSEINLRLSRLKSFETDRLNQEVVAARQGMIRVLEPRLGWFQANKVLITYHGSLQYHDPVHLDVDLSFISKDLSWAEVSAMDSDLEHAFAQPGIWPRKPFDTNFTWPSLGEIRREVVAMGESIYDPLDEDQEDSTAARWSSYVLSSRILFDSQRDLLTEYQQEVKRLAKQSQWLRDGIVDNLDHAIKIRMARRHA